MGRVFRMNDSNIYRQVTATLQLIFKLIVGVNMRNDYLDQLV